MASYGPILNLLILSKQKELTAKQSLEYVNTSQLLSGLPSKRRAQQSIKIAVLKVSAGILHEINSGNTPILTLLDLPVTFITMILGGC